MSIDDEKYKPKYKNACIFIKALPLSIMFQSIASGWESVYELVIVWLVVSWIAAGVLTAIDSENEEKYYAARAKEKFKQRFNLK